MTATPAPLEPGAMVGPYRTGRRLGGGGMGVVLEALDTVLNRRVALKVIVGDLADDPGFRARFIREAQAQASLDSPHVVHVYGHGEDDGRLWIATQLIPDGDLGAMIQSYGAPPVRTGLDLITQVAIGLADAHEAGLVHRDIKPANVLLRRRPDGLAAYLADFGIARRVDADRTRVTSGAIGTPSYMAPELHTGDPATTASDVYSLGCLLWAMLSGQAPYAGTSDYQIVTAHLHEPMPQLKADSPLAVEVNRILRTAMAKHPEGRYPSAAAMRDDLRATASLSDVPVVVEPPPSRRDGVDVRSRPSRRRLALVVVAALLVVLAGVGSAWALTQGDDGQPEADPAPTTSTSPSGTPTPSPASTSPSPTSTPSETGPSAADRRHALASLTRAIEDQGVLTGSQADCAARRWIRGSGLQQMIDAGFFDEHLDYVDLPESKLTADLQAAALDAVTSCANVTP